KSTVRKCDACWGREEDRKGIPASQSGLQAGGKLDPSVSHTTRGPVTLNRTARMVVSAMLRGRSVLSVVTRLSLYWIGPNRARGEGPEHAAAYCREPRNIQNTNSHERHYTLLEWAGIHA